MRSGRVRSIPNTSHGTRSSNTETGIGHRDGHGMAIGSIHAYMSKVTTVKHHRPQARWTDACGTPHRRQSKSEGRGVPGSSHFGEEYDGGSATCPASTTAFWRGHS